MKCEQHTLNLVKDFAGVLEQVDDHPTSVILTAIQQVGVEQCFDYFIRH